jgi:superfamily II DNA or RNA helicase/diadenosine tetraphosphate (Ap4A) HIT family hydrolase/phage repressor protein C with HTH and peptisase S24 domain
MTGSPFLDAAPSRWVGSNELAFALRDSNPVTRGHTLVIPKRLVVTWFEATHDEQIAILSLVDEVKRDLDREFRPDGFNVGFNAGVAAGQTVMHMHMHVIPRYTGDCEDPRGGIRGVIAERQKYELSSQSRASRAGEAAGDYRIAPLAAALRTPPFTQLPTFVHGDDAHFEHALRSALLDSEQADILSAFVQTSGVALLIDDLRDALTRGVQIRFLTGDYLGITSADALRMLLRLSEEHRAFAPFFYETQGNTPFHPKSYIFMRGNRGVAYVGSSNLSRSAMQHGVEWNLRVVSSDDETTFASVRARFDHLLASSATKRLTRDIIDAYQARAPIPLPPTPETRAPSPPPNEIQREALEALKKTRREGHRKGLVVLATGLGKTFLSAFDFKAMGGERALFVAHREEILGHAKESWESVFPDKTIGTYDGASDAEADIVFASVQTLSRSRHLARFAPESFDYIVVDEFHHAAASTYRKILAHFRPRFLLGLTATPDRMDGRPLLELCDDNLVYRRDLVHGITRRLLVPFHYFGIKDVTDYEPIPWRGGRFDAAELTVHVATIERANQTLREYRDRAAPGIRRTLAFCCTTQHADFVAKFFNANGIKAASVHSGPSSAPRGKSLTELKSGELEVICAVDIFNEGVDVPNINTILMLRPTESPVIFLQQLGRGLRRAPGKEHLTVIDFIGNHRSFLTKPQSLVFLVGQDLPALVALEKIATNTLDLPEGCSIDISTEAIDLLKSLVRTSREDIVVFEYMTFRDAHGRRPSASELFNAGVSFKPIVANQSTWFHFVREQGDLSNEEASVLAEHEAWFGELLRTKMTKAYKMLAVRALLEADALFEGMGVEDNARNAFDSTRTDLLFNREMREDQSRTVFNAAFVQSWVEMPLRVWAGKESKSQAWFAVEGERFVPRFVVAAEHRATFEQMTEELVELRLQQHRDRLMRGRGLDASEAPIVLAVSHSNSRPILRFDRAKRADIPTGPTFVEVDGQMYVFDFQKIAVNVATVEGSKENVLGSLIRSWLGPTAGLPGTRHSVRLALVDDGWKLQRDVELDETLMPSSTSPHVPFFVDVAAACGAVQATETRSEPVQQVTIETARPIDPQRHFVVRASGDSMNGGASPIRDGDLVLCEWTPGARAEDFEGQPTLLVGRGDATNSFALLKVPRRREGTWTLESWNPATTPQTIPAGVKLEPVARVLETVPEALNLMQWGEYNRDTIAEAFGSKNDPSWKVGHRDIDLNGHPQTILMVTFRKAGQMKVEHRYADKFLSQSSLQWDSQASTKADSLKGRRIIGHAAEGRTIHLFVQYDKDSPFTYFGPINYVEHEGETPMHVKFTLQRPLPSSLWKLWAR